MSGAGPPASQRRPSSPPAARQNRRALSSLGPQALARRRARAKPFTRPSSNAPVVFAQTASTEATGPRGDAGEPPLTFKSP
jgi:hypothetical protein